MSRIVPIDQKVVNFNGNEIMAVKGNDGRLYAGMRWVCNGLGLDENKQRTELLRVGRDPVLCQGVKKISLPTNGGIQEVTCIDLDFLPLWLAKINASLIDESEVFERLMSYQLHAKDVLAKAFVQPMSVEDMIIAQAQSVKDLKAEVHNLRQKVNWQDSQLEDVRRGLVDVNAPLRHQFTAAVKSLAIQTGMGFNQAYDRIYTTLSAQEHIDIKRRAENRGIKPIDVVEQSDLLVKAIRLAKALGTATA